MLFIFKTKQSPSASVKYPFFSLESFTRFKNEKKKYFNKIYLSKKKKKERNTEYDDNVC